MAVPRAKIKSLKAAPERESSSSRATREVKPAAKGTSTKTSIRSSRVPREPKPIGKETPPEATPNSSANLLSGLGLQQRKFVRAYVKCVLKRCQEDG